MALLKLTSAGKELERKLPFDGAPVTLGRADDNTWPLDDQAASRRHAEIAATADGYVIRDLGSSNGTWVNRERIESRILADGDQITIGGSTLVFVDPKIDEATVRVDMAALPDWPMAGQTGPPPTPPAPQADVPEPPAPASSPPAPAAGEPTPASGPRHEAGDEGARPATLRSSSARVIPTGTAGWQATIERLLAAYTGWLAATPDPPRSEAGRPAEFGPRLAAYLVDAVILVVGVLVITAPLTLLGMLIGSRVAALGVILSLVTWLLATAISVAYLLVPWARVGVTPGKRLLGLKIVRADSSHPLGLAKAALRMVGYMVSGALFGAGFIMIAFTKDKRGLHDMIANTRVVRA